MVDKKLATISVRLEEELNTRVDKIAEINGVNKSDFIRACLEKLANDNRMILDYCNTLEEYINDIKCKLAEISEEIIIVRNGEWANVSDFLIIMLCDVLWKTEPIYEYFVEFRKEYGFEPEKRSEQQTELFDLEDLVFLSAEKNGMMYAEDIPTTLDRANWINVLEASKISLVIAVSRAFKREPAEKILLRFLENRPNSRAGRGRFIVDAKGKFQRSGEWLYFPVRVELVQKRAALEE